MSEMKNTPACRVHKWGSTLKSNWWAKSQVCTVCGMSASWSNARRDFTTATRRELTALRARAEELREALDGLLPNSLKSPDGYCSIDGHVTIQASCDDIDRARTALERGEK